MRKDLWYSFNYFAIYIIIMSDQQKSISSTGFIIALLGAVFFSTKAIFVKLAFKAVHIDAITLLMLRMLFSLPFYLIIAIRSGRKENNRKLTSKQWFYIFLMGILGYYLSSLFDFIGLQYVSAGLERLILFLYPTFAVLLNTFVFKTKLNKIQAIALVLTYMGIGIAFVGELKADTSNPDFYFGSFMVFLCAVTYSFYIVGTGKIVGSIGVSKYTAYVMLFATAGIFIHYALTRDYHSVHFTESIIGYSLALAIIATVLPSFMMSYGMKQIGSNNVAIITSIGPVSTILQAYFILGENILPLQLAGTLLVVVGVILIGKQ